MIFVLGAAGLKLGEGACEVGRIDIARAYRKYTSLSIPKRDSHHSGTRASVVLS